MVIKAQSKLVFLVGVGAPASLYAGFLSELQEKLSPMETIVIEWWRDADFGMRALKEVVENSEVILIGHSAGGAVALQALLRWPKWVKRMVMLDSHVSRDAHAFPSVAEVLNIMLRQGSVEIKNQVEKAYVPVIKNDVEFYNALHFLTQWASAHLDEVGAQIKKMSPHLVLHIGFTNSAYQKLSIDQESAQLAQWGKYGIDVKVLPMNHFDLLAAAEAGLVCRVIEDWMLMY